MGVSQIVITLDGKDHERNPTFAPGEVVSGIVRFTLVEQKKIDLIVIILEGEVFTDVVRKSGNNSRSHHKEKIPLFMMSKTLFTGPYTMQQNCLEWPFSFTLPERTTIKREDHRADDINFDPGHQPLPPSTDIECGGIRPIKARVSYCLKAVINPYSLLRSKEFPLPIIVAPLSPDALAQPTLSALRVEEQFYRSNSLRVEQHSFKQKMKHVFGDDPSLKTPAVNFRPAVYLPKAASTSQPFPIALSINRIMSSTNDPENPVLILDQIHLRLKQYTSVRVKSLVGNYNDDGSQDVAQQLISPRVQLPLDGTYVKIKDLFQISKMRRDPMPLPPSFKTYTINQHYKLKVAIHVSLVHPNTRHIYQFDAETAFTLLPSEACSLLPPFAQQAPDELQPSYGSDGAAPPAYDGPSSSTSGPAYSSENEKSTKLDAGAIKGKEVI